MFFTSSFVVVRACVFASLLAGLALGTGCADDDTEIDHEIDQVCGGHGELHGDHCHCDSGYILSEDEMSCVVPQGSDDHDHEHDAGDEDNHDHGADAGDEDSHDHEHDAGHDGEFDFAPTETRASKGVAEDGTHIWLLDAEAGDAVLSLELYEAFGGPTSPGVVDITDVETDYATCGTCVILKTGCEAHGDHFHCERTFIPRAEGQLHLDEVGATAGDRLTGGLLGMVFQEVTIGEDYQTEPVSDGEVVHLNAWTFDVQLEALHGVEDECGGHGHLHGEHCHCDSGYLLDPENPTQCIPE